ncbi:MAG: phosphoglucosamine mutase, partial [Acidobacteria bacterium]
MAQRLFGTDGVRGRAGTYPLDVRTIRRLGGALVRALPRVASEHSLLVGRDTRESGGWMARELAHGARSAGGRVTSAGVISTPAVAYLTREASFDAGVVISASHNPFEDNGIKVFARDGYKLPDHVEAEIEALMASPELDAMRASPSDVGYSRKIEDSRGRYVVYCKATFP